MLTPNAQKLESADGAAKVLIVDDEHYIAQGHPHLADGDRRRATSTKRSDGAERPRGDPRPDKPDVVMLDWEMPGMDGAEFVRRCARPTTFPYPDVPIIMLTGHGERSRVLEAVQSRRARIPAQAGVEQGAARRA